MKLGLLVLTFLLTAVSAFADEQAPTTVELVTDLVTVPAGSTVQAGVLFKIKPKWHIYWKEPGDSGLPTRVKFILPEGSTAGELLWPTHERFVLPGDIKGNGYSNEVLLWAPISVAPTATTPFPIQAEVTWLNCSDDVCVREKKRLSKEIAIGAEQVAPESALFATWQSRLPTEKEETK